MTFKTIFFPMTSYPDLTSSAAIQRVIQLATTGNAHLSAAAFEMDVSLPSGLYGDAYNLPDIVATEYQRAAKNARQLVHEFEEFARKADIPHRHLLESNVPDEISDRIVQLAHVHDLTIMPFKKLGDGQRDIAESLLFGAGRPLLIFPEVAAIDLPEAFDTVVICWDNKGPAARAVGDALPFMSNAKSIKVLTIGESKTGKQIQAGRVLAQSANEVVRYLSQHGIEASVEERDAANDSVDSVIADCALKYKADLLVAGAYGHARLRELILGGVTRRLLSDPPGFVFLSR